MRTYIYVTCILFSLAVAGCEKDNLKEPSSVLTGRVIYQGQPVGVRSSGVAFEVWQPGYGTFSKIPLNIGQDGTFKATLFDGDYKLVRAVGAGPWRDNTDTISVTLKGSTAIDIPVEPFFIIKDIVFERTGTTVKATFSIEKNTTTNDLELARLYLGPNIILDQNNNSRNEQVLAAGITIGQTVTLSAAIPAAIANDAFIFARVGVKTAGIAELLYTPSQRIDLK